MIFVIMRSSFVKLSFKALSVVSLLAFLGACKTDVKRFIDPENTAYSEDVRSISKKINDSPKDAELYYKRSNTFFFEDLFAEAIADILVAIELNPQVAFYHFKLAEYNMASDTADAKAAERSYLKALELEPDMHEARLKYGILLLAKQRYEETVEQMKAILNSNPSNPDALFFLGMVNKETGDTLRAIDRFREVVDLNNTYYNAYMQLALLTLDSDPKLSLLYLDNALRIDEFSDEAFYTKGLLLQRREEFSAAKEFYKRTLELNTGHRLTYFNLAFVETQLGNIPRALEHLNSVLTIDPDYSEALHFRSAVWSSLNQWEAALKDLQKALELEPDNNEIKEDLERVQSALNRSE